MKLYLKPVMNGVAQTVADIEYQIHNNPTQYGLLAMRFVLSESMDSKDNTEHTLPEYSEKEFVVLSNFKDECVHIYKKGDQYVINDGRRRTSLGEG